MLQERKRPTFNWKAVDNATVATSLESTDKPKVDSTAHSASHGQDAQEQPHRSAAVREGRLAGTSHDRPRGKENDKPLYSAFEDSIKAGEAGNSGAVDVAKGVRRVERRRAAEGRVFEGIRRPRHKRMAAKRASHMVKG